MSIFTNIPSAPSGPGVASNLLRNVMADDFNGISLSSLWTPSQDGGTYSAANNSYEYEEYYTGQVTISGSKCSLRCIPYPAGISGNGGTKYYLSGTINTGVNSTFLFSPSNAGTLYIEAKIKIPGAALGSSGSLFPAFWATTYRTYGQSTNNGNWTREFDFFEIGSRQGSLVGLPTLFDTVSLRPSGGYGSGTGMTNTGAYFQTTTIDLSQDFHVYTVAIYANGSFTLWIDGNHQWDLPAYTATDWMGLVLNYAIIGPPGSNFTSDSYQIEYVSVWNLVSTSPTAGIIGGGTAAGTTLP